MRCRHTSRRRGGAVRLRPPHRHPGDVLDRQPRPGHRGAPPLVDRAHLRHRGGRARERHRLDAHDLRRPGLDRAGEHRAARPAHAIRLRARHAPCRL
jgi:hypothetical protein